MSATPPNSDGTPPAGKTARSVALAGAAAAGAAAGAAAFNRRVAQPAGSLPNPIGGEEGAYAWQGHRVAYTRRGAGPAVLLVHSIHAAAWSFEWRKNVDALAAAGHTVYTIDLLGFGRSDRPPLAYTARLYVSLLLDFVRDVVGAPCALVGSSLGGAFVVAVAARDPERFPAVVLCTPVGITRLSSPPTPPNDATTALIRAPFVGEALFNALTSRPSMSLFLRATYKDDSKFTPDVLDAYWQTAHQPGARFAPAAFVGMQLNLNVRDAARRLAQPVLITWGKQSKEVPNSELDAYRELVGHAEAAVYDPCGSLPHDERADEWNARVAEFLGRAFGAARGTAVDEAGYDGAEEDAPAAMSS
jgi:pimeloyl-ACP methyl ester carboxylesterase